MQTFFLPLIYHEKMILSVTTQLIALFMRKKSLTPYLSLDKICFIKRIANDYNKKKVKKKDLSTLTIKDRINQIISSTHCLCICSIIKLTDNSAFAYTQTSPAMSSAYFSLFFLFFFSNINVFTESGAKSKFLSKSMS